MRTRHPKALRNLHLVVDALTIVLSMLAAGVLHDVARGFVPGLQMRASFGYYAALAYTTIPLWLILVVVFQLHLSFERRWRPGELLLQLTKLHLAGLLGLALMQFLTQSVINRSFVLLFMLCTFAGMYGVRVVLNAWVRFQYRQGRAKERILLVGHPSKRMSDFVRDALAQPLAPEIIGYVSPPADGDGLSMPPPDATALEHVGKLGDLGALLHEQPVDHVMFFPPTNRPEELKDALASCEELGVPASFSVNLVQVARAAPRIASVYEHAFVTFDVAPKRPEWLALKYGIDPIAAFLLIVLLSPVFLLAALAILVTMGRPVFFTQERAGVYGRPFRMVKFRSMRQGAEQEQVELRADNEMSGPVFKIHGDPRITPLGRLLRKSSIDELPQLFNVLVGSMSLVGPRPLPLGEQQQIRGWQRRRLSMKPGITGLWQVSGRNEMDFEEWMMLDLQYIDDWSLLLDFTLLLRTVPAVLQARGAH
ncbi:MAG: exopolysaccharide biosynthesis polyprenyl glycosylphosphotransferase [Myxococcales bacterium]|nr:exopolysaccharide biosynthesis polyprenyl glycosylphosphotransferase [Myxococcales bacterium]